MRVQNHALSEPQISFAEQKDDFSAKLKGGMGGGGWVLILWRDRMGLRLAKRKFANWAEQFGTERNGYFYRNTHSYAQTWSDNFEAAAQAKISGGMNTGFAYEKAFLDAISGKGLKLFKRDSYENYIPIRASGNLTVEDPCQ